MSSCKICRKVFYVKPSHLKLGWGKYCSLACRHKSQIRGTKFKCYSCGRKTYRSLSQQKHSKSGKFFCSKTCQTKWRNKYFIEEKHANWKSGNSVYREILKRSRSKVVCVLCGIENELLLTAHHKDHNRNNNKISNLIWLCLNCHFLVHHNADLNRRIMHYSIKT